MHPEPTYAIRTDLVSAMSVRDMVLAALTSLVWGFGFVAVKFGLESFSAHSSRQSGS
jgi:hypothetical protein